MASIYELVIQADDKTKGTFNQIESGLKGITGRAFDLKKAFGVAAIAGAAIGTAMKIKGLINDMDDLAKAARAAGNTSEEAFKSYQLAGAVFAEAGISTDQFDKSMQRMNLRLQQGVQNGGRMGDIVAALGDNVMNADGTLKEGAKSLEGIAQAFAAGEVSGADLAEMFGQEMGPKIAAAFQSMTDSGKSFEDAMKEIEATTSTFSVGDAAAAEQFNDALSRIQGAFNKLFNELIVPAIPVLADMAVWLSEKLPGAIEATKAVFGPLGEAIKLVVEVVRTAIELFTGFIDTLQRVADGVANAVSGIKSAAGDVVDGAANVLEGGKARLRAAGEGLGGAVEDGWRWITRTESPSKVFMDLGNMLMQGLEIGIRDYTDPVVTAVTDVANAAMTQGQKFANNFGNTFANALSDGKLQFSEFRDFALNALADVASNALGYGGEGGLTGLASSLGTSAGNWFAGLFDKGGYIPKGKMGIVGERGPELVSGPANVTSRRDTAAMGASQLVTVNFNINAIDTQTGTEFVVRNKNTIIGVINQAMNQAGKPALGRG